MTDGGLPHSDPELSPNGNWVAFKTVTNGLKGLGIIHTDKGSKESVLYSSNTLAGFVWAPDSSGLYYQDGDLISFVRTVGGTPKAIGRVPGLQMRLMTIDPAGKKVYGTRRDASFNYSIFEFATDGQSIAADVVKIQFFFIDNVTIDRSGQRIGYTSQAASVPHAAIDVRRADIDGKNDVSLTGGPIPDATRNIKATGPRDLSWADDGTTMTFVAWDNNTTALPQVFRVSPTRNVPEPLTGDGEYQRSSVARDQSWMVFTGTVYNSQPPAHYHLMPVILPATGGARVPLEPEQDWVINSKPTIDAAGTKVVFAGYLTSSPANTLPELHIIELDREIRVFPRPALSTAITIELPVLNGERGTLFLSTGVVDPDPKFQFALPGFEYRVALTPQVLIPVLGGVGNGSGPLSLNVTVPNDPALKGFTVYLQGMRIRSTNPDKGDFTRYAELRFFE